MESKIFIVIIVICLGLLFYGLIKHRFDLLVNFGLRVFTGLLGIYLLNALLEKFALSLGVGLNGITALSVGLLGIPGFLMVYGVAIYFHLK